MKMKTLMLEYVKVADEHRKLVIAQREAWAKVQETEHAADKAKEELKKKIHTLWKKTSNGTHHLPTMYQLPDGRILEVQEHGIFIQEVTKL